MNETQILEFNAEPWYLRRMSEKELRDTVALAQSMLNDANPTLCREILLLIQKCESLVTEHEGNRLKETLWFH